MSSEKIDISDISGQLSSLLSKIAEYEKKLNQKSWYFAGSKTFMLLHGISNQKDIFTNESGTPCKWDQVDSSVITNSLFYDPRYDEDYVRTYNSSYKSYVIGVSNSGGFSAMDLKDHYKSILNAASEGENFLEAIHTYAAAIAMDKVSVLTSYDESLERSISSLNDISEFKSTVATEITKIRSEVLGLETGDTFSSYKADVNNMEYWYITAQDAAVFNTMIKDYKEAIDALYNLAKTAADNGGTIVNCINSINNSPISENKYSYINISQIMVCVANEENTTIEDIDDLDAFFALIVSDLKNMKTKRVNKIAIIITIIVCAIIIIISIGSIAICGIYAYNHKHKHNHH